MADQTPGLDQNQLHFFKTFGYAVLRKLLKPDELEIIEREHRDGLAAAFPDEPFDGTLGQWTRMMNEETPFFASLTEDPRFLTPAQQICGEDVLGNGTDAHFSVGNTDWHSDSNWQRNSEEVQLAVKYHFHLDPVTAETGALRFIPGSHLLRDAEREMFQEALDKVPLESVPCQAVPTQPGDVILFDIRTWHASLGGMPGRRVCNAEYFRNPDTTEGIEMLREIARLQSGSRNAHQFLYPKNWLANPHDSPVRQRWIDRFLEIDFLDQPGVGEM
jgi:hypothetical protein